jgi:hypothetical protein
MLHFRAFNHILEVHDFNPSEDSSDDGRPPPSGDSSESEDDDYPGYDSHRGILQLWPRVSKFASGHNPAGEPWPSLPAAGGGVWSAAAFIRALRPTAAWSAISQSSNGRLGESPCAPHVALSSSETAPAEVTQQAVGNMSIRS